MTGEGWEREAALSEGAEMLLSTIPADGSSIGNGRLRSETGLDEVAYKEAVDELVDRGLLGPNT
ncbi:MAG: hypothetical protein M0Z95_16540 [Actinomycetota bacterium]|jgi:hypothetical protein|nr:hypothetical protein [Actinomycetota bacterium]